MRIVTMAAIATSIVAGAAFAPAVASSYGPANDQLPAVVRIADEWNTSSTPTCRLKRSWGQDYSGKPYLRKVRVCA
ncbi:hypothetical protein JJB09_06530 [Rhizobium sp. KVB221]|uniref:Uncharacterized protein n=1 Tax=Rhizobium setariae TaxID=2801340 RepID=A0A937CNW0_9HYPH|nr:hypothetical protein [Rhizobium setariae]MBL0371678.1 hypothetical protein [Rhizobium setariae]